MKEEIMNCELSAKIIEDQISEAVDLLFKMEKVLEKRRMSEIKIESVKNKNYELAIEEIKKNISKMRRERAQIKKKIREIEEEERERKKIRGLEEKIEREKKLEEMIEEERKRKEKRSATRELIVARIKRQIRLFGSIDYNLAREIAMSTLVEQMEIKTQIPSFIIDNKKMIEYTLLLKHFQNILFYQCIVCFIRFFNKGDMKKHIIEFHKTDAVKKTQKVLSIHREFKYWEALVKRKNILIFYWESSIPYSPSKIKPEWWGLEDLLIKKRD
jgi:hypothetical protein